MIKDRRQTVEAAISVHELYRRFAPFEAIAGSALRQLAATADELSHGRLDEITTYRARAPVTDRKRPRNSGRPRPRACASRSI